MTPEAIGLSIHTAPPSPATVGKNAARDPTTNFTKCRRKCVSTLAPSRAAGRRGARWLDRAQDATRFAVQGGPEQQSQAAQSSGTVWGASRRGAGERSIDDARVTADRISCGLLHPLHPRRGGLTTARSCPRSAPPLRIDRSQQQRSTAAGSYRLAPSMTNAATRRSSRTPGSDCPKPPTITSPKASGECGAILEQPDVKGWTQARRRPHERVPSCAGRPQRRREASLQDRILSSTSEHAPPPGWTHSRRPKLPRPCRPRERSAARGP